MYIQLSIKLKLDMCIADYHSLYCNNFGVRRLHNFFTGYTKYHALCFLGSEYLFHFSIEKILESAKK